MKCPACGSSDLRETTEYNKAHCHIQYLINGSFFCFDCQCEEIKILLNNPRKSCDECTGTSMCPNSKAARNAVKSRGKKNKNPSDRKWEYGHRAEFGSDGKQTGRTESFRTDQNTGETESEFHTHFESS